MRKILDFMVAGCYMVAAFCLASCDSDLAIQQEYPFTVEAMPVADEIAAGSTVEIRLEILPEGIFPVRSTPCATSSPMEKAALKWRTARC